MRYSAEGLLQLGPLGSTAFLPDSKCLVDDGRSRVPALKTCEDVARPAQRLWDFTQVSRAAAPGSTPPPPTPPRDLPLATHPGRGPLVWSQHCGRPSSRLLWPPGGYGM